MVMDKDSWEWEGEFSYIMITLLFIMSACYVALRGYVSFNVLTCGATVRLRKSLHEKKTSSTTERVKQDFSCIPVSCPQCCVAVTLTPPLVAILPIRALLSIQSLKPVCLIGQGRWWWWGVPLALFSPSLPECFSLTVCDSCTDDCSHTLSPPVGDHIPFLLNSTSHPPFPSDRSAPLVQEAYETLGTFIFKQTPCSIAILSAALACLQAWHRMFGISLTSNFTMHAWLWLRQLHAFVCSDRWGTDLTSLHLHVLCSTESVCS